MAITDPTSFPLSSGAITFTRVNQDGYSSEWLSRQTLYQMRMKIRHSVVPAKGSEPAKDRHNVEVVKTVYATSTVAQYTEKVYLVFESIQSNSSVEFPNALANWLIASTNAQLTKLVNWES